MPPRWGAVDGQRTMARLFPALCFCNRVTRPGLQAAQQPARAVLRGKSDLPAGLAFGGFDFGDQLMDRRKNRGEWLIILLLHRLDPRRQIAVCMNVRMIAIFTSTARGDRSTLESIATPCSVKAYGR